MPTNNSIPKRLGFSLLAFLVFFGLLETGARLWEFLGPEPSMPLPTPQSCGQGKNCLEGAAKLPEASHAATGQPTTHSQQGIPMVSRPRVGWGFKPGTRLWQGNVLVSINSLGLRGPEIPRPKPPGEIRIMAMGDSTVFGYGVDYPDTFPSQIAAALSAATGTQVRSIDAALPGFDSRQSLVVLRELVNRVEPDWLLVACIWSDLYNSEEPVTDQGILPLASYRLLVRVLGPWLAPRSIHWLEPELELGTPAPDRSPRVQLAAYMANLREMASVARSAGAGTIYVSLPAPIDLDPAGVPTYIAEYRQAMAMVARQLEAPMVDGPAYFRTHRATAAMFYDQVHPSPAGHHLMAQAVVQVMLPLLQRSAGQPEPGVSQVESAR